MHRLAIAALAALFAFPLAAQAQTTFGLRAGLNVSDFSGDGSAAFDPKLGFTAGAFAHVPIGAQGFYVQPEASYTQKGAELAGSGSDPESIAVDYAELALPIGYAVPVTETGLTLGAYVGPTLAFKVREDVGSFNSDAFTSTDAGVAFGATVGAGPFAVDGRYTLGLTNALDSDSSTLRNGVFTIGASYRF